MANEKTADKNWMDPNTYIEMMKSNDMTKMFENMKVPGFEADVVTEAQKKNMQAFVDANRVAAEGYQALFKKQVEIMQTSVADLTEVMKEANAQPMSSEGTEKRLEMVKGQFEKGVAAFTEMSEQARKANEEAMEIIRARFNEGVQEIKDIAEKAMKSAA